MDKISKYLTYDMAVYSDTARIYGIENKPNVKEIDNLIRLGGRIYDPIVEHFGLIFPSSVFRCLKLNTHPKVGGSANSDHVRGRAIDLDGDAPNSKYKNVDNNKLFHWIRKNLKFDQLIAEFQSNGRPRWVHVGYREGSNRGMILIATKNSKGETVYLNYTDTLYKNIYKFDPKTEMYVGQSRSLAQHLDSELWELPEYNYDGGTECVKDGFIEHEKTALVDHTTDDHQDSEVEANVPEDTNNAGNADNTDNTEEIFEVKEIIPRYSTVKNQENLVEVSIKLKNFPGLSQDGEDPEILISVKK